MQTVQDKPDLASAGIARLEGERLKASMPRCPKLKFEGFLPSGMDCRRELGGKTKKPDAWTLWTQVEGGVLQA